MAYYIIYNNTDIYTAENQQALLNLYPDYEVKELPVDYDGDKYKIVNGELVLNPDWEEEQEERERQRIDNLQITKRVFMLGLQKFGITYAQLKALLATNEQAQMEWDLCVELQRKNPLIDVMAAQFGVTSETIDYIFEHAGDEGINND